MCEGCEIEVIEDVFVLYLVMVYVLELDFFICIGGE